MKKKIKLNNFSFPKDSREFKNKINEFFLDFE